MKKSFVVIMLVALTGCIYGPNYQYKDRRLPIENCKFLKKQATENVEMEDKVVVPDLNDDLQHEAVALPQEVQLRPRKEAVRKVQPSSSKSEYVVIKPKDKRTTAKISKKSKAAHKSDEIKLADIPPKQTSAAQYKQTIDDKSKEIKSLEDKSKKLDDTAKAIVQPTSPDSKPQTAAVAPVVAPQVVPAQPAVTPPTITTPTTTTPNTADQGPQVAVPQTPTIPQPALELPKLSVVPQTSPVPPAVDQPQLPAAKMSKPDESMHGDLESNVDAFLNQKNFDSLATSQQDVSSNLPSGIEKYAPGSKPMPVPSN